MDYYTSKQIFYINSANRLNQSESTTNFSHILDIDNDEDYTHVVVLDCSIPKTSYSISSPNNTFTIDEEIDSISSTRTITMSPGNYTRDSFRKVLKSKLNDNPSTYVYDITYENINNTQDTGKYFYSWTNINGTAIEPTFNITNFYEQMGFNKNSTNTFVSGSLTSSNVINLRVESTYFILSDICQQRGINILQNITSVGTSDYNYIVFKNQSPYEYAKLYTRTITNTFNFNITDENFNNIDINGLNVIFTLMLFKKNDINSLIKGYIKYRTLKK